MKKTMTARLSVSSHRNGVSGNEGNRASKTCGIVSPTMMQNAIMPPKALQKFCQHICSRTRGKPVFFPHPLFHSQSPLCNAYSYQA